MENLINNIDGLKVINGSIQDYTIVLSSRDLRHLGQLTGIQNVNFKKNLNSADEMSFTIIKYDMFDINNKYELLSDEMYIKLKENLWNQIVDLKLIWVKELNKYFEIKVKLDDSLDIIKNITATSLCEAELGQTKLYNIEINTENDIARDDYDADYPTIFYREDHHEASLLHRIIEKAPHYSIKYVDDSLKKLSFIREFTIDDISIYDFLTGECAEQYNCLFIFDSSDRSISVYDMYTTCQDCGYRGDYYDECPECGSTNLKYYGEDTTILVDKTNLTDSISLEANVDEMKNCFKLVAGDEYMTATIRMLNQNGSDYIYYIPDLQKADMPKELVHRLNDYDDLYNSKTEEYQDYVSTIYDLTDQILYLTSGKMPTIEEAEITATTEAEKLNAENLSPIALINVTESTSVSTVNSALKNYAKVYVKSGYVKIEVNDGATFEYTGEKDDGWVYGIWKGSFTITNYSDEEDVATTPELTISVYDNYEEFVKQKVLKQIAAVDEDNNEKGSIFDVLAIENIDEFKEALKLYCKNRLTSFYDAIQGALDILVQLDQASETADLYESLYLPYYQKLEICQEAIDSIQAEIDDAQKTLDDAQKNITKIQNELNFKDFLGEYYTIFCAYRREDKYSNENFISDDLDNSDMLKYAKEFIETAKKELVKSGEKQWTLSSTLYNLLVLPEFQSIVKYFELGNWIRLKVDGQLYRLRLIGYGLNFDSIESLEVEFSTVSKVKSPLYEAQQIMQATKSMATSYSYVSKQADKGSNAQNDIESWKRSGLDSGLIQIKNGKNEEITYGKNGLLCRAYDDITKTYSDQQIKIIHNAIAFTDNNWKSVRQMIGQHNYIIYNKESSTWENKIGYGNTADFVTAGHISGSVIIGGEIYSHNYSNISGEEKGTYIDLANGSFSFAGGGFTYDGDKSLVLKSSAVEEAIKDVGVTANNLHVKAQNIDTVDSKIKSNQIESIKADQILDPENINISTIDASNINGQILSSQIQSIDAEKINGKLLSDQIESITADQVTGTNNNLIDFIDASKISGTVSSSQIDTTLSDKTLSNCFFDTFKTINNETEYIGITGDYVIGDKTFKIINGLIVSIS